ncbi:MAG TPA: ATPase [Ruminiclostridium sp.]|nr:ATPase [Ruminiclostridium sp.]
MSEGIIRHMYPGGNTPIGFFSYYPYIIDRKKAKRIYILKGGPGTGKSTLMRKVGLGLAKKGLNVEFMHCSSDNNSLDGVVIPDLGIAMVDGTAPHIVDPVYPGAVDEIINLGQYWNEEGFEDSRQEIIAVNSKIKSHFATAYRYLRAASALQEDTESIYEEALDKGRENLFSRKLILLVLGDRPPAGTPGDQRCLFASAITPRGFSDYLDSLCINHKIIRLSAPAGISTHRILEALKYESLLRGLDIETFFCPMSPHRIEHIVIPELSVSIITANEYHDISVMDNENCSTYFVNELYEKEKLERFSKQLGFNRLYAEALLERAIESIASAKASHDELEKHYIKNMDFNGLSQLRDHFLEQFPL